MIYNFDINFSTATVWAWPRSVTACFFLSFIFSAKKSAGKSNQFVDLIASNIIAVFHALFVSQCVGAAATDFSTYLLLGIDFVLNMYFQFRVFYLYKKKRFEECSEELQSLVLNEFLEAIIPLLYLVCFLAAFYGPNAEIIGINFGMRLSKYLMF